MLRLHLALLLATLHCFSVRVIHGEEYDVIIYAATPAGVSAALAASGKTKKFPFVTQVIICRQFIFSFHTYV
jgi:hypothetical protein